MVLLGVPVMSVWFVVFGVGISRGAVAGCGVVCTLSVWCSVSLTHSGQFELVPIGHASVITSWAMERMFIMLFMGWVWV